MGYICKIGSRYYYRVRIPKDLLRFFPVCELKKSLKTTSRKSAKALVKVYGFHVERLFTLVRSGMLTGEQVKKLISEYLHDSLKADEDFRITHETPSGVPQVEKLQRAYQAVIAERKAELAANDLKAIEPQADTLLHNSGIELDKGSAEYKKLCRELLKAEIAYFTVGLERYKGNYQNEYDTRFNSLFPEQAPVNSSGLPAETGKTLTEAITLYMAEKQLGNKLKPRSVLEYESVYRNFQEVITHIIGREDVRLSDLNREAFHEYLHILSQLPANAKKAKGLKGKAIGEILEAVKDKPINQISAATKNKNIQAVSTLLKWCVRQGYIERNPAEGLGVKEKIKDSEKTAAYTKEEMEKLFHTPVFTQPDKDKPERFWLPLIALFQGTRLEEIAQLYIKDIKEVEGIICLDLRENTEDKSIKTGAGQRTVPLHPFLIELGFLDYVANVKARGVSRVWPGLKKTQGRYGKIFGNWYSVFKSKLFPGRNEAPNALRFHSFRDTFIDNLARQGVDWKLIKDLAGHNHGDITKGTYAKVHMDLLFDAIKKLDYGVDLSHLQGKAPL